MQFAIMFHNLRRPAQANATSPISLTENNVASNSYPNHDYAKKDFDTCNLPPFLIVILAHFARHFYEFQEIQLDPARRSIRTCTVDRPGLGPQQRNRQGSEEGIDSGMRRPPDGWIVRNDTTRVSTQGVAKVFMLQDSEGRIYRHHRP